MPVDIQVKAVDNGNGFEKGFIVDMIDVADIPARPWGESDGLPLFVHVIISDATKAQVQHYISQLKRVFEYDLIASNAAGRRYTISVPEYIVDTFGLDKGVALAFHDWLTTEYGAILFDKDLSNYWATYDIPNTDWQALLNETIDKFDEFLSPCRYHFTASDVDIAVANGGEMTITKAQALARIVDRLAP